MHRSILAGLIGHVAHREERNSYKAVGNRQVALWPGSALYVRGEPRPKQRKGEKPPPQPKSSQPEWLVAGEIVETSQLFARTVAGIDPQWIFQLAPHCCKLTHQNSHWSASAGNVLVEEIVTLRGLEVQRRKVSYGNINPEDATAIFIRSALVEENLLPARSARGEDAAEDRDDVRVLTAAPETKAELPPQYKFLAHNRSIREKIENWRTRVRSQAMGDVDQVLAAFYARHITGVSSVHDLNRLLREPGMQQRLCITEEELASGNALGYDAQAFPDAVHVGGQPVAVAYAYAPGEDHDGVTIELPFSLAQTASASLLEWSVPGLREEMAKELLRALPKSIRRELMPFPPKVSDIVREFQPTGTSFLQDLAGFLHRRYGVPVKASDWPAEALPAHLRPRIEIVDHQRKSLGSGRDLAQLQQRLKQAPPPPAAPSDSAEWARATQQWERFGLSDWNFGDLPERVTVKESPELPVYGWPGVEFAEGSVNVRLFRTRDQARAASLVGVRRLVELAVQKDLAWLEKDLRALSRLDALYAPLGDSGELRETALEHLRRYLLPAEPFPALTRAHFDKAVAEARARLPGLAMQFMDRLGPILQLRQQVQQRVGAVSAPAAPKARTLSSLSQLGAPAPVQAPNLLAAELAGLVSARFLERVSYERLVHLPRYLKALLLRAERAALNPVKNQERLRQLMPYQEALKQLQAQPPRSPEGRRQLEVFRWMVEEFKVSLFAQELGTAMPVSAKRLDQQLEVARQLV